MSKTNDYEVATIVSEMDKIDKARLEMNSDILDHTNIPLLVAYEALRQHYDLTTREGLLAGVNSVYSKLEIIERNTTSRTFLDRETQE